MVVKKGNLVSIIPFDDVDVKNELFIIDKVDSNYIVVKSFDNKTTIRIEPQFFSHIVKLERNKENVNRLIEQTQEFLSKNTYNDLQSTIDIIDEFEHLIYDYEENYKEKKFNEYFGALAYEISLFIENLKYDRKDEWTCNDLNCLETAYLYAEYLCNFII